MPCWICGVGDELDNGICPRCTDAGYTEDCVDGCYSDPNGERHECPKHEGNEAERAYEQYLEHFYGGSTPTSVQEQYSAAAAEKRARR